jgi:hypothetical protein
MAFKMKYKNLHGVVDELRNAVKAHGKQADIVEKHIDKMKDSHMKKTVSWTWGGEKHYGEYIREDKDYVYARTVNDKIKKKPKNK